MVKPRRFFFGEIVLLAAAGLLASGCGRSPEDEQPASAQKTPAAAPSETPAVTPAEKPAAAPAEKPAATPSEKPAATPSEKPAATPSETPAARPSNAPAAPSPPAAPSGTSASSWQPDPAMLGEFEPYQDVKGYQVRVPKGWTLLPRDASSPANSSKSFRFSWQGPQRDDGTRPELQISAAAMPPSPQEEAAGKAAAATLFDEFLSAMAANVKSHTDKETGQLNGIAFVRSNLTERLATGAEVQGAMYVGRDGPTVLLLRFYDAPSHWQESAKLGTAAILTFRKKP